MVREAFRRGDFPLTCSLLALDCGVSNENNFGTIHTGDDARFSRRSSLSLRTSAKDVHIGFLGVAILPSALNEVVQIRHILLHSRLPQIWAVLEDAEHIVDIEQWPGTLGLHQYHGFVLDHSHTELKHDIGVVLCEIGDYQICLDKVVNDRGLNHVAALPVGGFNFEVFRGWRDDTAENLGKESLRVFWIALDERQDHERCKLGISRSLAQRDCAGR
jgi:hypothetical protein